MHPIGGGGKGDQFNSDMFRLSLVEHPNTDIQMSDRKLTLWLESRSDVRAPGRNLRVINI